ncbi:hypothetical protein JNJ66_05745 [Candidatus Saccharibacteria bacterium]|nr:hypothetical protein [Candidatus Saccharibacteria bacterium]
MDAELFPYALIVLLLPALLALVKISWTDGGWKPTIFTSQEVVLHIFVLPILSCSPLLVLPLSVGAPWIIAAMLAVAVTTEAMLAVLVPNQKTADRSERVAGHV